MADRRKQLNEIDTSNLEFCEIITSSYKLEDFFPDDPYLVSIFKNYRSRKLNDLTMFWCFLTTFMHWSSETTLFDKELADYVNLNLYGILRGCSVSHKSGYMKPIRQAFNFVERYFRAQFIDSNNKIISNCIESMTPAKLIDELQSSSKFVSSDEDRPLTDFGFFEPDSVKANDAHPSLITAFNGAYNLQRATMTYSKTIRDRSLTMLIPTTGNKWPLLLDYFSDSHQTDGLYERVLYWVIGKKNFVHENSLLNEDLPCLEYLLITRMLIGKRIYEYDNDALNFLRPILHKMRNNEPSYDGLYNIPKNKRAEACERRGADLIVRIAATIQNIFDTLQILKPIKSINFNTIKKCTLNEIKMNIGNYFYSNEMLSQIHGNQSYPDDIDLQELDEVQITTVHKAPTQSMKIKLSAAKIAVNLFHKLLLPQSIQLFCTDSSNNKSSVLNELKIIQYPVNCFSISDLTYKGIFHNQKRNNVDVKELLSNLEKKRFLKYGKFIKSACRVIDSWIKVLPDPTNNEEVEHFRNELNASYQLNLDKYIDLYEQGVDDKALLTQTAYDILSNQRSWVHELQTKNYNGLVQNKSPKLTTDSFTIEPQLEPTSSDTDLAQDIIQLIDREGSKPVDIIQDINISSVIEDSVESTMQHNSTTFTDDAIHPNLIQDCLSDIIKQAIDLVNENDTLMIDSITCPNNTGSPPVLSSTCPLSTDCLITERMKSLCKKILLSDSIILSSTKLNKVCKINMIDVHKACRLLIENGLLSREKNILANKSAYYECYLKKIPYDKSSLVDFSFMLAKFGIMDINTYYDTLKTIDTKNTTYLSPYGMSLLEQKPYSDLKVIVDKNAIIQPSKERYHELSDGVDVTDADKENVASQITIGSASTEQDSEHLIGHSKRRRELTDKAKEYKQEKSKAKRKKI